LSAHVKKNGECMAESQSEPTVRHPIWPVVVIAFGLSLTAVWVGLLGYGLYKLIDLAI